MLSLLRLDVRLDANEREADMFTAACIITRLIINSKKFDFTCFLSEGGVSES
jgi:hypothetical protein